MSSYVLFTLDKLVQKVVKQMQLVLQEEQTHRLVELWKYEDARGVPVSGAGQAGGVRGGQLKSGRPGVVLIGLIRSDVRAAPLLHSYSQGSSWQGHIPATPCRPCRLLVPDPGPRLYRLYRRSTTPCTTPTRTCCCRATPASALSTCPTAR